MEKIKLFDLLSITGIKLTDYKIHCATTNPEGSSPMDAFREGRFKQWQEYQGRKNFPCKHILSLIQMDSERWLFAGVFEVHSVQRVAGKSYYEYDTTEVPGFEDLIGRVILSYKKTFRQSYLRPTYIDRFVVAEIRPERLSVGDFPGYNRVLLSHSLLKVVVRQSAPSWKVALSNVSGVYLIVDTSNGKQYVGSAYGAGGIWGRWSSYAETGHGGNKELAKVLETNGIDHARYFQFSILEISDINELEERVRHRETHWKNVLWTRQFGYNSN